MKRFLLIMLIAAAAGGTLWSEGGGDSGAVAILEADASGDRVEQDKHFLDVPYFGQGLEWPWGGDYQGDSQVLIAYNGCAMVATAMVMNYHGVDIDPRRFNKLLLENDGYSIGYYKGKSLGHVNIKFDAPQRMFEEISGYSDYNWNTKPADIELIKAEIRRGNPVIVTVLYEEVYRHMVVVYGYEGDILYILDPIEPDLHTINFDYNVLDDEKGGGPARNIFGAIVYYGRKSKTP